MVQGAKEEEEWSEHGQTTKQQSLFKFTEQISQKKKDHREQNDDSRKKKSCRVEESQFIIPVRWSTFTGQIVVATILVVVDHHVMVTVGKLVLLLLLGWVWHEFCLIVVAQFVIVECATSNLVAVEHGHCLLLLH